MILSILITTYNCEKYIDNLLNSITKNNKLDYEIIIYDDCSSDNTVKIIKTYNFPIKLKVSEINKKYPGIGLNWCLEQATGKFLHIIDGDDIVNNAIYNTLNQANEKVDVFEYSYNNFSKVVNYNTEIQKVYTEGYPYEKTKLYYKTILKSNPYWNKIYRTSFIKKNKIKFVTDRTGQDGYFNLEIMKNKPIISFNKEILYYYRIGISSISTKITYEKIKITYDLMEDKIKYINEGNRERFYLYTLLINCNKEEFEKIAYFYKEKNIVYLHNLNNINNVNRFFEYLMYKIVRSEKNIKEITTLGILLLEKYGKILAFSNVTDRKELVHVIERNLQLIIILSSLKEYVANNILSEAEARTLKNNLQSKINFDKLYKYIILNYSNINLELLKPLVPNLETFKEKSIKDNPLNFIFATNDCYVVLERLIFNKQIICNSLNEANINNIFFKYEEGNFWVNEYVYNLIVKENMCIENLIAIDGVLSKYLKDEPIYWQETSFTYLIYKKGQINILKQEIESYKNNF